MFVLVVHNFDDPRLSPIFPFASLDAAKGSCDATWGDAVRFINFENTPDETAVSADFGLVATIYERDLNSSAITLTNDGERIPLSY